MQLAKIDLNLFIVFEVIYREGNLTRAARILNITQPAVSNALSRLRNSLDDPLFERYGDRMKPTAFAENLIGPVRESLWLLNNGLMSKSHFDPRETRKVIRISMSDLSSALLLPTLLPALREQAPGIVLETRYVPQDEVVENLTSFHLDFSIQAPQIMDQRLQNQLLLSNDYVCMVRKDHPVVHQNMTLDVYLKLNHIHTSSRPKGPGHVDLALNRIGEKRKIAVRLQNYLVAPELVKVTDLALTIPRKLAANFDLVTFELPFKVPEKALHLYWSTAKEEDPANQWLRQLIIDTAARV